MARTQIKLLIFLIALGIMLGCVAAAFWIYQNIFRHDAEVTKDIAALKVPGHKAPDPGARRFDAAIDLVKQGQIEPARDALYKLLQQFPKSASCAEAKRIIGEMNMDALYRLDKSGGKKDYIVQPGQALLGIAAKNHTTLEALARINSLTTINLKPGDHLFVIPMEFDLVVDVSEKKVALLREGRFFKEYSALGLKLPPTLRVPADLEINSKSAIAGNKAANPVSPEYASSVKSIVASKNANSAGLLLRTPPVASKIVDGQTANAVEGDASSNPTGVFLAPQDLEEIYPLLRKGSRLSLVQ
jgi:hypothetical protein